MTTMLKKWDPAEHLDSEEAAIAYIDAALDEADPQLIAAALSDIARARGRNDIAVDLDGDASGKFTNGPLAVSADIATILRAIHALGLSLHVTPTAAE